MNATIRIPTLVLTCILIAAAVADGGVIKIMPGSTRERHFIPKNKRIKLIAPMTVVIRKQACIQRVARFGSCDREWAMLV
jgi:hypothetical protein